MGARGPIPGATEAQTARPECPKHLDAEGKKIWNRVVDSIEKYGAIVSSPDEKLLEKLVVFEQQWEENQKALLESGQLYKDPVGRITKSPRLAIMQELGDQIIAIYRELGMTPVSRRRFGMTGKVVKPGKLALMLAKKNGTDGGTTE